MVSVLTAGAISIVMFALAMWKGRTGWHWLVLTLIAFASFWFLSAVVLHFSDIRISITAADRKLALFVGAVTAAVMFITIMAVPNRPRRRHPSAGAGRGAFVGRRPPG